MAFADKVRKFRSDLRIVVEDNSTTEGRYFDSIVQTLIIVSLIVFSIETLPSISDHTKHWLRVFDSVCVLLFTVEYQMRVLVAKKPLKYVFSFFGFIDLFAVLPFYISTGIDLRYIRIFRIFKLFRSFEWPLYHRAMRRLKIAAHLVKQEMVLFMILIAILMYIAAAGIYVFEHNEQPDKFASVLHSLWWSAVTLTTVGYGDTYPITVGGRIFTFFMLLIGIGIVTIPAGLMASALGKAREIEEQEEKREESV